MTVYHYCTLDSFMSIISNKSIWLSDITKSNDSMEIKWITRYINDIFDEEFEKERNKTKYFAEGFKEEKEWRLTHFTSTKEAIHDYMLTTYEDEDIKVSDIELHPRKDDLVPHIALRFDYIKDKLVKEVVIGPKCKARQNDVERFLQQNGFNCKVTASQGTYR